MSRSQVRYAFPLILLSALLGVGQSNVISAHTPPPLLPESQVAAMADESSGETAKRNLEGLARFHRQRGSQGFHAAAELIAERARAYGLSNVEILQFPTDGKTLYGTRYPGHRARRTHGSTVAQPIGIAKEHVGDSTRDCRGSRRL